MSAHVLVTGAAGFVGAAVMRRLVSRIEDRSLRSGARAVTHAIAVVRPGASLERLEQLPASPSWSIAHCDVTDRDRFATLVRASGARAVMHLAVERDTFTDETAVVRDRITAPLEGAFRGLAYSGQGRVIYASSVWVLPAGSSLDETTPAQPASTYGRNKVYAERQLPELRARWGGEWINLRLFNTFGRFEAPSRLLPHLVWHLSRGRFAELGSPILTRDFTDVDRMADAFLAALEAPSSACGSVYHIGSGQGTAIRDFAMTVAEITGGSHLLRFNSVRPADIEVDCQVSNPARAHRVLGWSAPADPRPDIREVVRWWLSRIGPGSS